MGACIGCKNQVGQTDQPSIPELSEPDMIEKSPQKKPRTEEHKVDSQQKTAQNSLQYDQAQLLPEEAKQTPAQNPRKQLPASNQAMLDELMNEMDNLMSGDKMLNAQIKAQVEEHVKEKPRAEYMKPQYKQTVGQSAI